MRAFDIAHVVVSVLAAAVQLLAFLDDLGDLESLGIVGLCVLGVGAGAAIVGLFCRWWPGRDAAGWKLWLAAWLFNPAVFLGLLASPVTLIAPTIAIIVRAIARNIEPERGPGSH